MRFLALLCAFLCLPGVAQAKWMEASSDHFVVYAEASEASVRKFSEQLESFHAAMVFLTGANTLVPSPSNRVTVYVVGSGRQVRALMEGDNALVAGFYRPRAGGSIAVVSRITPGGEKLDFSMIALLHEYAHHFMIASSTFPVPSWLTEGSAEYYSSASFERDGHIKIGMPAYHRAGELSYSRDVTVEELLDPAVRQKKQSGMHDAFYGKSWLFYHYLQSEPGQGEKLKTYYDLLVRGKKPREAGLEAFGDFKVLEKELDRYLARSRIMTLRLPPDKLKTGPIAVRALGEGEGEVMPYVIRSRVGVTPEMADKVVPPVREIAARYPADAAVQTALAEAEFDAGNDQAAIAAADAALAIDPKRVNAYVQKGYALFRMAGDGGKGVTFQDARKPFIALNKLENDHPLPLYYYYRGFVEQGTTPPDVAIHGLERAVELAPFDYGLRMTLAMQQIGAGDWARARANLGPIAYNPHGGAYADRVRSALERLDTPGWNGSRAEIMALIGGDDVPAEEAPPHP